MNKTKTAIISKEAIMGSVGIFSKAAHTFRNQFGELVVLGILSCFATFLVMDLFAHPGRPLTFDGRVHITTIQQYYLALKGHEFPVQWANGWSTYGFPLGLVAHQVTSYLGAGIEFLVHDPALAYNWVALIGALSSTLLFYVFMRLQMKREAAFVGTLLFAYAPYRIVNLYTRGALPEFFSSTFMVLALLGVFLLAKNRILGTVCLALGIAFTGLTHPMMLIPLALLLGPYVLLLLLKSKQKAKDFLYIFFVGIIGLLIASYYLLPLNVEIQYFNYGLTKNHYRLNQTLMVSELLHSQWDYYGSGNPAELSENLSLGTFEVATLLLGVLIFIVVKDQKKRSFMLVWVGISLVAVFLMLPLSDVLYRHSDLLGSIQYPSRMFSVLVISIPVAASFLFEWYGSKKLFVLIVLAILVTRLPVLYGKTYIVDPQSAYTYIQANLHTLNLNPIWLGNPLDYPVRTKQYTVIGGQGTVDPLLLGNAMRLYEVHARTDMRMLDYTTFFPGWLVFVDGAQVPLEFQDVNARGLLTYNVPKGDHQVKVVFVMTRIRKAGYVLSFLGVFLLFSMILILFSKKYFVKNREF